MSVSRPTRLVMAMSLNRAFQKVNCLWVCRASSPWVWRASVLCWSRAALFKKNLPSPSPRARRTASPRLKQTCTA